MANPKSIRSLLLSTIASVVQITPAPVNTVLPVITGTAQEGQVLTVSNGTWSNNPSSYAYQWFRDGLAITGSINNTRSLTSNDVGKVMTCSVTASNAGGTATATSAATATVIAASVPVPVNTVAPVISGTNQVGQTLTATNGTWTNSPTGYTYQWRANGVDISGATASTFVVTSAQLGATVLCRVTATNAGGNGIANSNSIVIKSVLGYTTLYGFDTIGTAVAQSGAVISIDTTRKVMGAGALLLQGNGKNAGGMGAQTAFTLSEDMAGYTRVAMYVDCGNFLHNPVGDIRPYSATGPYGYKADANTSYNSPYTVSSRGWRWNTFYWPNMQNASNVPITTVGASNKVFTIAPTARGTSNAATNIVVDQLIRVTENFKPVFIPTFDDANISQFDNRDMFATYGVKPTLYVPHLLVGNTGRYSLSQLKLLTDSYGWGVGMDSEGSDNPLNAMPTVDGAITEMLKVGQWLDANGFDPRAKKHFCYSYGGRGIVGSTAYTAVACTSDGANQSTIGMIDTAPYSNCFVGQYVRGPGVPVGTYVTQVNRASVKVNNPVTAGTGLTLYFLGRESQITITADGSNVVTVSNALNLHVGMHMFAYGVPGYLSETPQAGDTRITDISGNTVTLSNNIPSTVTLADFGYADSEWWETRVVDKLIQAGMLTGRLGTSPGGTSNAVFTGYGVDPKVMMQMGALVLENQSAGGGTTPSSVTNKFIAQMDFNIKEGRDTVGYGHLVGSTDVQPGAHWPTLLAYIQGRVNAGELEVMTLTDWSDLIYGRSQIS